ncbi:hypothetical protein LX36DRAFT_652055 [Colletotrichum falcatum]|nr:hypothetical protein LX36DRAFT_652055 [Colletotrichum falcatum]
MHASVCYFALAGLAGLSQASPIANPDPPTDPRGLIARSIPNILPPGPESPPTKRQALPSAAQAAAAAGGAINKPTRVVSFTIEKGDTLGQLSKLFNSGVCDIAKLNNIANPNVILAGAPLKVTINVPNPDNVSCFLNAPAKNATESAGGKKASA